MRSQPRPRTSTQSGSSGRPSLGRTLGHGPRRLGLARQRAEASPEALGQTCVMRTDVGAGFRFLKSAMGLRPVFHHKRTEGPVPHGTRGQHIRYALRQTIDLPDS